MWLDTKTNIHTIFVKAHVHTYECVTNTSTERDRGATIQSLPEFMSWHAGEALAWRSELSDHQKNFTGSLLWISPAIFIYTSKQEWFSKKMDFLTSKQVFSHLLTLTSSKNKYVNYFPNFYIKRSFTQNQDLPFCYTGQMPSKVHPVFTKLKMIYIDTHFQENVNQSIFTETRWSTLVLSALNHNSSRHLEGHLASQTGNLGWIRSHIILGEDIREKCVLQEWSHLTQAWLSTVSVFPRVNVSNRV